ncbi:DUF5998 family protein [Yaniella flava]|uniref:DUF5998 family protein n=1 Tax=Yaniella flava TaxID=287930 RepID=A0ABN2ULD4_9MICC
MSQPVLPTELALDIERAGFYPQLVADVMVQQLGDREILSHYVHVETHFGYDDLHRHITVLVLASGNVLAALHLNDLQDEVPGGPPRASVATEIVPLSKIGSCVVTTGYDNPQHYEPGEAPSEVTLVLSWAGGARMEFVPNLCDDPDCDADHGYMGTRITEDLVLRIAGKADGQQAVNKALAFSRTLRDAILENAT